jgi:murein DD-endopeptidase MepM/ murein hydrolase activator NlpD
MHPTGPDVADEPTPTVPAASAIVPHDEAPAQEIPAQEASGPGAASLRHLLPLTARVGFVGIVLFVIWWTWPRNPVALRANQVEQGTVPEQPPAQVTLILLPTPTRAAAFNAVATEAATAVATPTNGANAGAPLAAAPPAAEEADALQFEAAPPPSGQPETIVLSEPVPTKVAVVLVPTETPTATPTNGPEQSQSELPQVRIIPAVGIKLPPTRTPSADDPGFEGPPPTPTPEPLPIEPGRLWSSFTPLPAPENDHFWVGRPFLPSAPNQVAAPSYQFGSTAGDRYRPHHGMDMSNPMGTPVLAATEGEVVHAGMDDPELLGPYNNFYGNAVVIRLDRKLTVGDGELDVYVLYGHLSQVFVTVGQRVGPQDVVGAVGMTGIAIGPHLHVEMRLGANTYRHSVNPYLWVQPLGDTGAVAVRLLTADGRTWPGARLTLARFEGGRATWARLIETYLDTENIGPDPAWGENGAMDGVPPGYYVIVGNVNGESVRAELTVNAGQTTFVEIRTQQ